jgi:hypothetical protein
VSASPLSGSGRFRPDPDVASGRAARRGRGCVQEAGDRGDAVAVATHEIGSLREASPFSGPKLEEKRANSPVTAGASDAQAIHGIPDSPTPRFAG